MPVLLPFDAIATQVSTAAPVLNLAPIVTEASQKSGVPEAIIWAVIDIESAGKPHATSSKGAMGLMQVMPGTWAYLRGLFDLGPDAFDPRDNILAGAYYLRLLYDAYGWNGFLAAYNAGPGRYENHRATGHPLPAETQAYVTALNQKLGAGPYDFSPPSMATKATSWKEAGLFYATGTSDNTAPSGFAPLSSPFVVLPSSPPDTDQ